MKKEASKIGINIGHTEETVQAISKAIIQIITAPHVDEETKRSALEALHKSLIITGVSVTNCSVEMSPSK